MLPLNTKPSYKAAKYRKAAPIRTEPGLDLVFSSSTTPLEDAETQIKREIGLIPPDSPTENPIKLTDDLTSPGESLPFASYYAMKRFNEELKREFVKNKVPSPQTTPTNKVHKSRLKRVWEGLWKVKKNGKKV